MSVAVFTLLQDLLYNVKTMILIIWLVLQNCNESLFFNSIV